LLYLIPEPDTEGSGTLVSGSKDAHSVDETNAAARNYSGEAPLTVKIRGVYSCMGPVTASGYAIVITPTSRAGHRRCRTPLTQSVVCAARQRCGASALQGSVFIKEAEWNWKSCIIRLPRI
jgi:hypothetical protein